jgi:hypothetical protein
VNEDADWHEQAMRTHEAASARHDEAALHWSKLGDARIERELVELERDMARVARERPIGGARGARDERH